MQNKKTTNQSKPTRIHLVSRVKPAKSTNFPNQISSKITIRAFIYWAPM